jgi:competence protein ComEC
MFRDQIEDLRRLVQPWLRHDPLACRPLIVVAAVMAVGCGASRLLALPGAARVQSMGWWLAAVIGLVAWARLRASAAPAAAALLLAIGCGAASWSVASFSVFAGDDLAWRLSRTPVPVALEARVIEPPRRVLAAPFGRRIGQTSKADQAERLASETIVAVTSIRHEWTWLPVSGRAVMIVDGEPPAIGAGDTVRIFGRAARPQPALNPGEFDPCERARMDRCLSMVRVASASAVTPFGGPRSASLAAAIDAVRCRGAAILRTCISPARFGLASALLIGGREALPRDESQEYLVTGTVHILSISGLHVGILAWAVCGLARLAGLRRWAMVATVVTITGAYMLLVRAETPVVRSTIVVWLATVAAFLGRRSHGLTALAAAAIVVLVWQPGELFRIGTQLSFLSTAVLVLVADLRPGHAAAEDPIARLIDRSRSPFERWLRRGLTHAGDIFFSGGIIWAATAPIVALTFHLVSPVALLLNPLIAPLIALAMASGFCCLLTAAAAEPLALACGGVCDGALQAVAAIVSWGSQLPGGHAWVRGPSAWWVAGWYAVGATLLVVVARERLRQPATWACAAAGWCVVGLVVSIGSAWFGSSPGDLRAVVVAMGHGCGVVVRSPAGRCLVYDAGRLGAPAAAARSMSSVLWQEGIARIDTLVLSHADADHFNAVPDLLQRFAVGELVVSRVFADRDTAAVGEVLLLARQAGVPIRTVQAGESFALDRYCRVRVLQAEPRRGIADGTGRRRWRSDNETSLAMTVEASGRRLLLTGDMEGDALASFVAADPDACDVLVAPHHGSVTSLPPDIALATAPEWVFVSGLGGSRWPEVRDAYAAAVGGVRATVMKTGGEGAIAVDLAAAGIGVSRFTAGAWQAVGRHGP